VAKTVLGVLVSGRGSNLQAILDAIHAGTLNVSVGVVISDNPQAQALSRLDGTGIPSLCVERGRFSSREDFETALANALERHEVNLVVLAGFMRLLGPVFLRHFTGRVMNVHPSLLPAFPGLDPQGQAIRYGVKLSGCTVHFVDEGMDSGPVILQQAVPVLSNDTSDTLAHRILEQEHLLYPLAISLYSQDRLRIRGRQVEIIEAGEVD
jgi:phosphoribosylglycinamide formyltransferase-1